MISSPTIHVLVVVCSTLLWSMASVTTVHASSSRRAGLLRIADWEPSSLRRTVTEAGDLATTVGKDVQHQAPFPTEQQPSDDQKALWNEDFEVRFRQLVAYDEPAVTSPSMKIMIRLSMMGQVPVGDLSMITVPPTAAPSYIDFPIIMEAMYDFSMPTTMSELSMPLTPPTLPPVLVGDDNDATEPTSPPEPPYYQDTGNTNDASEETTHGKGVSETRVLQAVPEVGHGAGVGLKSLLSVGAAALAALALFVVYQKKQNAALVTTSSCAVTQSIGDALTLPGAV